MVSPDGETMHATEIRRRKVVDNDRFVKLFVAHLDAFFDLKPGTMKLMTALLDGCRTLHVNGDTIYELLKVVEYFDRRGVKPPAKGTFFNSASSMIRLKQPWL